MSGSEHRLSARCRRLLLCYPRAYRRERGREIVDIILDQSPPGRSWPTVRQSANLVRHGLRCRLGRPASRSVVVWAALTAVVWGLFAAALSTRVAWETARPLPSVAEATTIFESLVPRADFAGKVSRSPAMFVIYGQPLDWQHGRSLLLGDGGEYQFGETAASLDGAPNPGPALDVVTQRLRANGWQVGGAQTSAMSGCASNLCDPSTVPTSTTVTARRGLDIIEISIYSGTHVGGATELSLSLQRATPWAVYPAGLMGGMLGAFVGWLMFGWASRRTEYRHVALKVLATAMYGMAMFLWVVPTILVAPQMLAHDVGEANFRWHPLWEWLGQPTASLLFLAGSGLTLVALACAVAPQRVTGPETDAIAGA